MSAAQYWKTYMQDPHIPSLHFRCHCCFLHSHTSSPRQSHRGLGATLQQQLNNLPSLLRDTLFEALSSMELVSSTTQQVQTIYMFASQHSRVSFSSQTFLVRRETKSKRPVPVRLTFRGRTLRLQLPLRKRVHIERTTKQCLSLPVRRWFMNITCPLTDCGGEAFPLDEYQTKPSTSRVPNRLLTLERVVTSTPK